MNVPSSRARARRGPGRACVPLLAALLVVPMLAACSGGEGSSPAAEKASTEPAASAGPDTPIVQEDFESGSTGELVPGSGPETADEEEPGDPEGR